jgi:multiple sugar transport system ATP-binding protein/inositol-phosphate transport system ATP-binding protein
MAKIELCGIKKKYGKIDALKSIDLIIEDKEFLVLFGPAGAGKTTILKLIAGIELPTEGTVKINGETVNLTEASDRNVAMVFENYALYPHMTVYDNIAFPLRSKRYQQDEEVIKKRIESVTRLMKIDTLLDRLPAQISNGQKQRVALGRSLVRTPNVFLMDEPLAHLDAKMRHFMRAELKEMQGTLSAATTLYVTHDYMEALSLGDRIAILNEGAFEQIGTGKEIYNFPANEFVAKLVGEPEINIFPVRIKKENRKITLTILGMEFTVSSGIAKNLEGYLKPELDFGIRAKFIQYHLSKSKENCIKGKVYSFEPIGNKAILLVDAGGTLLRMTVPNDINIEINTDVYLTLNIEKALFFDIDDKSLIGTEK